MNNGYEGGWELTIPAESSDPTLKITTRNQIDKIEVQPNCAFHAFEQETWNGLNITLSGHQNENGGGKVHNLSNFRIDLKTI